MVNRGDPLSEKTSQADPYMHRNTNSNEAIQYSNEK